MKKFLFLLISILFVNFIFANPVDLTTAEQVAKAYFKVHNYSSKPDVNLVYTKYSDSKLAVFYVYNLNPTGFVIVSADDAIQPILAYSLESNFLSENIPENIEWWLNSYKLQIQYVIENNIPASTETAEQWQRLLSLQPETNNDAKAVANLLPTTWGQQPYYNNLSPLNSNNEKCVTGCTATAMAQIMKYWNYPTSGTGSHSYSTSTYGGTLSANFGNTTYEWNNMPNALNNNSSPAEINAVATLMYHCGVAVEMNYKESSSGAATNSFGGYRQYCAEYAFKDFFKYKSTVHSVYRYAKNGYSAGGYINSGGAYSDTEWKNLLKTELDAGRPVIYTGETIDSAGHAFVCDGYDNSDKFHFNWGWRGSYDGYYTVNNLMPNDEYFFSEWHCLVIGIEPASLTADIYEDNNSFSTAYLLPVVFNEDIAKITTNSSNFHNNSDEDYYKINLPFGSNYTITARLHDSDNSGNGISYTVDAKFAYSINNDNFSNYYDYAITNDITLTGGGVVYFYVKPYYSGSTGRYLLDITITRTIGPDQYEPNNTIETAYNLPVTFIGNNAEIETIGSNLHTATDEDFYRINLPSGYNYIISAFVYDYGCYYNGVDYNSDVVFAYNINNETYQYNSEYRWSIFVDDVLIDLITIQNGGSICFYVKAIDLLHDETGNYLLYIAINRELDIDDYANTFIKVYPNPAKDFLNIELNDFPTKVNYLSLINIYGQEIVNREITGEKNIEMSLENFADGIYYIQIKTDTEIFTKKVLIQK